MRLLSRVYSLLFLSSGTGGSIFNHHHLWLSSAITSLSSFASVAGSAAAFALPSGHPTTSSSSRARTKRMSSTTDTKTSSSSTGGGKGPWKANDAEQAEEAKKNLDIWPLDEYNAALLNEVHPRGYGMSCDEPFPVYDLIAVGAGAGGLVSSRQSARRGAKSAMISANLAGGDCLNVGCVPSKSLLRSAKALAEVRRCQEFGIVLPNGGEQEQVRVDFSKVMERVRAKRTHIAPVDGHSAGVVAGSHVFQGRGKFVAPDTLQVGEDTTLKFKKCVIATGGRPSIPKDIPGLQDAPYTTNEILFNLQSLPPNMVILGAGVVALEMAQCFATFGSNVTVISRADKLFQSKLGDPDAADVLQKELEKSGVNFIWGGKTKLVTTLRERPDGDTTKFPLMKVTVEKGKTRDDNDDEGCGNVETIDLECECLLVATGRVANVENMGLEDGNVEYELGKGIKVNDLAQSVSNPNVYAVGDCVAGVPRLTHMSGEMAKLVVQNSLFDDEWKLSSLVVPACMYTEPEYATFGLSSVEMARKRGDTEVDVYKVDLEHNDRAILEGSNVGFCKVFCRKGTDEIVGATVVADRAGEIVNELSLAMKNGIGLRSVGRNIHCYPTTGECVMMCGVQYINSKWKTMQRE